MEKYLKIERPNIDKIDTSQLIKAFIKRDETLQEVILKTENPKYLYWTECKNKPWFSKADKPEKVWAVVKFFRALKARKTIIKSEDGQLFRWSKLSWYDEMLHHIDLDLGGNLMGLKYVSKEDKQVFVSRGIMEEAIASSQMEGAHTTRKAAQLLLREGREPKDHAERMIVNNYKVMKSIESDYKAKPLSRELLAELHEVITRDTLDDDITPGVFRRDSDDIIVTDPQNALVITHKAPKMAFVDAEIDRLIKFANGELDKEYIHPVIKAIMLHFWIGYLHPYGDGNGRLARVLFYWYLLKNDYWAFAYFPISSIIKKSKSQYSKAYIYSEQDDYDLTYFIDYNLRKIQDAQKDFQDYLEKKSQDNKQMNILSRKDYALNARQVKLLQHLHGNPDERTNVTAHINVYGVSKATAVNDLKALEELGFISPKRQGRYIYYYPSNKIHSLFNENGA